MIKTDAWDVARRHCGRGRGLLFPARHNHTVCERCNTSTLYIVIGALEMSLTANAAEVVQPR
jgi:hypothetical protein